MEYTIKIPEIYLIHIAATGKMGSGDLMDNMKFWAQRECDRLGLKNKVREAQTGNIKALRERLNNTLGKDLMGELDQSIKNTLKKLNT